MITPARRGSSVIWPDLDLPSSGIAEGFDVILGVGNVMPFLAPSTRRAVLANLQRHLREDGRLVVGFGSDRGYEFPEFMADATEAGLVQHLELATWDLHPDDR